MNAIHRKQAIVFAVAIFVLAPACTGLGLSKPEPAGNPEPIPSPQFERPVPEPPDIPRIRAPVELDPTQPPIPEPPDFSRIPAPVEFDPSGLSAGPGSGFIVLDDPSVVPGSQASWLDANELVLGITVGDAARAYPITQMAYHHIANDQIGGEPYLVTY